VKEIGLSPTSRVIAVIGKPVHRKGRDGRKGKSGKENQRSSTGRPGIDLIGIKLHDRTRLKKSGCFKRQHGMLL